MMGNRFKHRSTALSGIWQWLQHKYPDSEVANSTNVPGNARLFDTRGINTFLQEYRKSRNSNPSKDVHKNAEYVQRDFVSFARYCKEILNK